MIQEGIYATLAADAGVSSIVGNRIFPILYPQKDYTEGTKQPCVVYKISGRRRQIRYGGTDTLVSAALEIECYSTTYAGVQALAAAVRDALVDFSGTMTGTGSPQSSNNVQSIFIESEDDGVALEPGLYVVMQDYTIWYDEA